VPVCRAFGQPSCGRESMYCSPLSTGGALRAALLAFGAHLEYGGLMLRLGARKDMRAVRAGHVIEKSVRFRMQGGLERFQARTGDGTGWQALMPVGIIGRIYLQVLIGHPLFMMPQRIEDGGIHL